MEKEFGAGHKPDSVPCHRWATKVMVIPLGFRLPEISSDLPESSSEQPSNALLFGLAPGGVCRAPDVTVGTGELLPHRFTLTPPEAGRFAFCGTFLLVAETGRYPAPCPVESGLSSRSVWRNRRPSALLQIQLPKISDAHRAMHDRSASLVCHLRGHGSHHPFVGLFVAAQRVDNRGAGALQGGIGRTIHGIAGREAVRPSRRRLVRKPVQY